MTQETRKDPRAKVLTMTVRYKSATLDEFIEHHSYDVSRGGMFIKTPSPFPPGTLLKFEVKISGEQRVMQGVGRVVWKRESSEVSDARPAGMGVKFIKIDDESRKVIDQLVAARGEGASAFDQGSEGAGAGRPPAREIPSQVVAPTLAAREPLPASKPRKATMLGLGAMQAEPESPETAAAEAFFPPTDPVKDMPPPEDRTVMKQAAELLQDALREAGGSLDEVGSAKDAPAREVPKAEPAPAATPAPATAARSTAGVKVEAPAAPKVTEKAEKPERSVIVNSKPRDEVTQPAVRRTSVAPSARRSEPPKARPALSQEATNTATDSGGSGRFLLALVAVAAAAAVVFFLRKPDTVPEPVPEPPPPAAEAPPPEPAPQDVAPPTAPEPTAAVTASAAPGASAAPSAAPAGTAAAVPSATPKAAAAPSKPTTAEPAKTPVPAARPAPVPKPVVQPPTAKPAAPPAETKPPEAPSEPVAPSAPTTPPAAQPTQTAPETPKPPAVAKPKPKPAAPSDDKSEDNPY